MTTKKQIKIDWKLLIIQMAIKRALRFLKQGKKVESLSCLLIAFRRLEALIDKPYTLNKRTIKAINKRTRK